MQRTLLTMVLVAMFAINAFANKSFLGEAPPSLDIGRFVNIDSKVKTLADYSGDVTLVCFFASWCGPCRLGSATLDKLQKQFARPDFHIISVSSERYTIVKRYLYHEESGVKVTYPIAVESGELWQVSELPQLYLVGRDGTVVWESKSYEATALVEAITRALSARNPQLLDDSPFAREMLKFYAAESYKTLLDAAKKSIDDENTKATAAYFLNKVQDTFERYEGSIDASLSKGDVFAAHNKMLDIKTKFKDTYYESFVDKRIAALEAGDSFRRNYDLLQKFDAILKFGRTGKPDDVSKALTQLKELHAANSTSDYAASIERMIDVLSHPWNPEEAHGE